MYKCLIKSMHYKVAWMANKLLKFAKPGINLKLS